MPKRPFRRIGNSHHTAIQWSADAIHLAAWIVLTTIAISGSVVSAREEWIIGRFSAASPGDQLPDEWEPLTFRKIEKQTRYSLVRDSGQTVVRAVCHGGSSGLIRHVRIDPEEYPIIEWRWKIANIFNKGDVTRKSGDDYPARLYVTFEFDSERASLMERVKYKTLNILFGKTPPAGAINYIWASKAPEGTVVPSPYTDRSMMIVVRSGKTALNQWVSEKRDLYSDFIAAFGEKPTMISGIAIMTDGNDTGESAVAYYGDIILRPRN